MLNLFLEVSQFCSIFSAIIFPTEILPRGQAEHTICSSMEIRHPENQRAEDLLYRSIHE